MAGKGHAERPGQPSVLRQVGMALSIAAFAFCFLGWLAKSIIPEAPKPAPPRPSTAPAPKPASPRLAPTQWTATIGDRVEISSPQFLDVTLGRDLDAIAAYDSARSIRNMGAVEDLHRSGRAARVPLPVHAIVTDMARGYIQVRITDGPAEGSSGWITRERLNSRVLPPAP